MPAGCSTSPPLRARGLAIRHGGREAPNPSEAGAPSLRLKAGESFADFDAPPDLWTLAGTYGLAALCQSSTTPAASLSPPGRVPLQPLFMPFPSPAPAPRPVGAGAGRWARQVLWSPLGFGRSLRRKCHTVCDRKPECGPRSHTIRQNPSRRARRGHLGRGGDSVRTLVRPRRRRRRGGPSPERDLA
jgi:hypothetical protein